MNRLLRNIAVSAAAPFVSQFALADIQHATVAVGGYDVTSYFEGNAPIKGSEAEK
jgi:hypothetical protein